MERDDREGAQGCARGRRYGPRERPEGPGQVRGTRRVTRGVTTIMPTTARKLSWNPIEPTLEGSTHTTASAAIASVLPASGRLDPAMASSAAEVIHTARRAGTPQSASSA